MACEYSLKLLVIGIVQGVGFRPFIYRAASRAGVRGYVRNLGGSEVEVLIQGNVENVHKFLHLLASEMPPPARIEEISGEETCIDHLSEFKILPSLTGMGRRSMIPPDIGICEDCLREVLEPGSRWHGYPFNSCAWCGPRFSMMYGVPYDRANTSMRDFPLCEDCKQEYSDPENIRRFHAQGISCPNCGPKVWLTDSKGLKIQTENPIATAGQLIDEGYIVGVKGLGGFHIAALATDEAVVAKLRDRKNRPSKPFALMALDIRIVEKIAYLDDVSRRLLTSPEKPIVLLKARDKHLANLVAPGLDVIGVMLPYTALHYLLLKSTKDKFLIMTSGNKRGKPMCIDEECAFRELSSFVDFFLLHDRRIVNRVDDSVVRLTEGSPVFLRRSRGYAPMWIRVPLVFKKPVIAFGADFQSAGAVAFEDKVVLTQYIGDLDDYDILTDLERYLEFFVKVYRINPSNALLVVDKHPRYTSRLAGVMWSRKYGAEVMDVQHHHAHAASVLADRGVEPGETRAVITIDGAGYGVDGAIWGGEVLEACYRSFRRIGQLAYQPMPGGDAAARNPVRMLIGVLSRFLSEDEVVNLLKKRNLIDKLKHGEREARVSYRIARKSVLTSSTGRVLDAASALLNVCYARTYEGEPAIRLEAYARRGRLYDDLHLPVRERDGVYVVNTTEAFEYMLEKLDGDTAGLAYTLLFRLGEALASIAARSPAARRHGVVYVSGGASVNDIIIRGMRRRLAEDSIRLQLQRRVPPGDGGIALGQAVIVSALTE